MIKVVAKQGLRVPMADNPHEYIEQSPIQVNGDDVYYRRLIADGDLMVLPENKQPESKKGKA